MYINELRTNIRPLSAACIGMAFGSAMGYYAMSLFAPSLIKAFGWSKSSFALVGSLALINLLLMPVAGWLVDRIGARRAAMIGFTVLPAGYLALASMNGSITLFFMIIIVQNAFGGLASSLVFLRVVVQRFEHARGMALSLVMMSAPLGGAISAPLLGALIDHYGFRSGYLALAALSLIGGAIAIVLLGGDALAAPVKGTPTAKLTREDIRAFARDPLLRLLLGGIFLIHIPFVFASSQLKLVAMASGASSAGATRLVSLYAAGVVVGRGFCGIALDYVRPHVVAIFALGLPALGYGIFAMHLGSIFALYGAIMLIGLAQGAEGDIGAYILSRRFNIANFSLLFSVLTTALGVGGAAGAILLSATLRGNGTYDIFLLTSAASTLLGALLVFLTGYSAQRPAPGGHNIYLTIN